MINQRTDETARAVLCTMIAREGVPECDGARMRMAHVAQQMAIELERARAVYLYKQQLDEQDAEDRLAEVARAERWAWLARLVVRTRRGVDWLRTV